MEFLQSKTEAWRWGEHTLPHLSHWRQWWKLGRMHGAAEKMMAGGLGKRPEFEVPQNQQWSSSSHLLPLGSAGWTHGSLKTESENQTWIEFQEKPPLPAQQTERDSLMLRGSRENGPFFLLSLLFYPRPQKILRWWWQGSSGAPEHLKSWEKELPTLIWEAVVSRAYSPRCYYYLSCSPATWTQIWVPLWKYTAEQGN